jgi:hypothetical protein
MPEPTASALQQFKLPAGSDRLHGTHVGRGAEKRGHVPHKDSNAIVATKINTKRKGRDPSARA